MDAMDKQLRPQVSDKATRSEQGVDAFAHLTPLVHQELRRLEQRYLQRERTRDTGRPTALVTGALANRAVGRSAISRGAIGNRFIDQKHFFTVCARQMRRILVEHAKERVPEHPPQSNEGKQPDTASITAICRSAILELDQALIEFEQVDADASLAFELYYFGGHGYKELAVITKVSEISVQRQLRLARAWLLTRLQRNP
jgi:RNA polymerase sigma factor (TIGR02999 family)